MTRGTGPGRNSIVAALVATLAIVVASCAPPPPPPLRDATTGGASVRRPIVIVHGWQFFCGSEDAETWKTWIDDAVDRGYDRSDVAVFSYDTCQSSADTTARLATFVDEILTRTGAEQVNVIAHSMGSLMTRWCNRFGGCAGKIDKVFGVAPANHGTVWANVCEMAFWSLSTCDLKPDGAFLAALNAEDETWGDTEYVTMISWCDLTIVPFESARLDGAVTNIVTDRCLSHTDWRTDHQGAAWALDWFDGATP